MHMKITRKITEQHPLRPHPAFEDLAQAYPTPEAVQKLINSFEYNSEEEGETVHSALTVVQKRRAHCLEAAFASAAILEHHGYPPLVLSLESVDLIDHVVFVFRDENDNWGAIGRSREPSLHGRRPKFKSLRELAKTYQEGFVDGEGRVTGYALAHLDDSGTPWRHSRRCVRKAERFLVDLPHAPLPTPEEDYQRWLKAFMRRGQPLRGKHWW